MSDAINITRSVRSQSAIWKGPGCDIPLQSIEGREQSKSATSVRSAGTAHRKARKSYEVERVEGVMTSAKWQTKYCVKWMGLNKIKASYPNSWVLDHDCFCAELIADFNAVMVQELAEDYERLTMPQFRKPNPPKRLWTWWTFEYRQRNGRFWSKTTPDDLYIEIRKIKYSPPFPLHLLSTKPLYSESSPFSDMSSIDTFCSSPTWPQEATPTSSYSGGSTPHPHTQRHSVTNRTHDCSKRSIVLESEQFLMASGDLRQICYCAQLKLKAHNVAKASTEAGYQRAKRRSKSASLSSNKKRRKEEQDGFKNSSARLDILTMPSQLGKMAPPLHLASSSTRFSSISQDILKRSDSIISNLYSASPPPATNVPLHQNSWNAERTSMSIPHTRASDNSYPEQPSESPPQEALSRRLTTDVLTPWASMPRGLLKPGSRLVISKAKPTNNCTPQPLPIFHRGSNHRDRGLRILPPQRDHAAYSSPAMADQATSFNVRHPARSSSPHRRSKSCHPGASKVLQPFPLDLQQNRDASTNFSTEDNIPGRLNSNQYSSKLGLSSNNARSGQNPRTGSHSFRPPHHRNKKQALAQEPQANQIKAKKQKVNKAQVPERSEALSNKNEVRIKREHSTYQALALPPAGSTMRVAAERFIEQQEQQEVSV
ncbi:hypothetical protein B0O99DRAFT_697839 [Bisporella sp. PMI_857]|nr:hypothetical protein B0O99DRAFT_697839 [Bisporella sp. PMI_857]